MSTHAYVTATELVRITVDIHDPLQDGLPGLPAPLHGIVIHRDPLDCMVDPRAWPSGGAWWEIELDSGSVTHFGLSVRDGDDADSVERRVMESMTVQPPHVEWFDMDRLEHEYHNVPGMDDREAAVYAAVDDLMPHDPRRWVGLVGLTYTPEVS